MSRLICLALCVSMASIVGCGARAELAKDKVLAEIDKRLGDLDVKRKKIEVNKRKIDEELGTLRKKRIETQVRLDLMIRTKNNTDKNLASVTAKLKKFSELAKEVAASGSIERNGKTYDEKDINDLAASLTSEYKVAQTKVANMETSIGALTQSVNFLDKQEKSAKDMMLKLSAKIEEIDSKKVAIDAVKQATSVTGGDKSIAERMNALDKEIDEMFIGVETAMKLEEEKLNEMDSQTSSADELLAEADDINATISDIDALLGAANGEEKDPPKPAPEKKPEVAPEDKPDATEGTEAKEGTETAAVE